MINHIELSFDVVTIPPEERFFEAQFAELPGTSWIPISRVIQPARSIGWYVAQPGVSPGRPSVARTPRRHPAPESACTEATMREHALLTHHGMTAAPIEECV